MKYPDRGKAKVKNSASQYVTAESQEKDSTSPKVIKGGDLRAKSSK